jgi:hypothetical protein
MIRAGKGVTGALAWQYAPVAGAVFVLAAFAWAAIGAAALQSTQVDLCISIGKSADGGRAAYMLANLTAQRLLSTAVLMAASMALPLAWRPALCVYARSFRQEAWLSSALLAAVFAGAWVLFLIPISMAGVYAHALSSGFAPPGFVPVLFALGIAAWRLSPRAEAVLRMCHRTEPVRAFAPGIYLDAAAYGWRSALACAQACAPGMLLPFLCNQPLLAMTGVTAIAMSDRFAFRPDAWRAAAAYAAVGLLANA